MTEKDELREEYERRELGKGTRGKYYEAYSRQADMVVLDPDVAKAFPDSRSVNRALRKYLQEHPDEVPGKGQRPGD